VGGSDVDSRLIYLVVGGLVSFVVALILSILRDTKASVDDVSTQLNEHISRYNKEISDIKVSIGRLQEAIRRLNGK